MSNDPITAKVVSTHEPTSSPITFGESWLIRVQEIGPDNEDDESWYRGRTAIAATAEASLRASQGNHVRILRLPSEAEAALAPLVEARDRAAVELAKFVAKYPDCEALGVAPGSDLLDAFIAAQQALDAAIAATKGTG